MEVRTSQGWLSRIGDSFGGAVFGFVLFLASFALLFWNEGRAVRRAQDLEFGADNVIKAGAAVDPKNEGKLIHVTGDVTAQGQPVDNELGVTAKAVLLDRQVEMYQWKEKTSTEKDKKLGGSEQTVTRYTYDKVWSTELFDSGSFKEAAGHTNPNRMPYRSQMFIASGVKLGAYTLDHKLVDELSADTDLVPAPTKLPSGARVVGNQIYIGGNPQSPAVGDLRVTYRIAPFGKYTVVGGQKNGTLDEFVHEDLNDPVALVSKGIQTPEMMFKAAEDGNAMMTLILRAVGFLMMFFGLRTMSRPLSVLADVLPILGTGVGFVTGFVSFFIALGLSFVTIAVAWIFYRPLVGLALLLVAGGAIAAAVMYSRKKSRVAAA